MSDTRLSPSVVGKDCAPEDSSWTDGLSGQGQPELTGVPEMVCVDPASRRLVRLLTQIAPTNLPVIITGESGTGKEVVARYVHKMSGRSGAFVSLDCNAMADRLAEMEAAAGGMAFDSRAVTSSEEWFAAAQGGTLFLDELAALPPRLQSQFLRVLGEHEALRAIAHDPVSTDIRLIAGTRVDVSEVVSAGHFSVELFYRLNVGQIRLLPLRQRRGDIAALANHFLCVHGRRLGVPSPSLSREAVAELMQHPWTGNIRELEDVIRCALLVTRNGELGVEHLKLAGVAAQGMSQAAATAAYADAGQHAQTLTGLLIRMFQSPRTRLLDHLESQVVGEAFRFTGRNQVRTAALLGISRNVLRTLLRKHGVFRVRRRSSSGRGLSQGA